MDWYRTSIADGPTLQVLMSQVDEQVKLVRSAGKLPESAQAYAVTEATVVRLFVNETARRAIPALNALAFQPCSPPNPAEMQTPLIAV